MDPQDPSGAPPRRRFGIALRLILGAAVFGLILVTSLALVILPHLDDEGPFDDSDLLAAEAPIPADLDAGPGIRRALRLLDGVSLGATLTADGRPLTEAFREARFGSFAEGAEESASAPLWIPADWDSWPHRAAVEAALAAEAGFFEAIDEACLLPRCSQPAPSGILDGPADWLTPAREAWEILRLRSEAAFARGDSTATVEADLSMLRYAARSLDGAHMLIETMSYLWYLSTALTTIDRHFAEGHFDGHEARLSEVLRAIVIDRSIVSASIRCEYRLFRDLVLDPSTFPAEAVSGVYGTWSFHPNETLRILGTYYRAAIAEGEATGRVIETPQPEIARSNFDRIRRGNPLGQLLLSMALVNVDGQCVRVDALMERLAAFRARVDAAAAVKR